MEDAWKTKGICGIRLECECHIDKVRVECGWNTDAYDGIWVQYGWDMLEYK